MRTRSLPLLLALVACDSLSLTTSTSPPLRPNVGAAAVARRQPSRVLIASVAVPSSDNARSLAAGWGVCGVVGILANAIKRLAPIAVQPLMRQDLSLLQWGMFGGTILFFAYVEGFKAFQKKFSPLVVRRAMTLTRSGTPALHSILAPFYSMGLFHASKKRKTVSWSISLGVAAIIGLVKRLPYPYRSIVDAGVVVGLAWGSASILALYAHALMGSPPGANPELPD